MNKIILLTFFVSLFLLPIALACTSPLIYNEYGVPINIYGSGILVIKSSDFPEGSSWVKYPLNVSNKNSQELNISLTPDTALALVVKKTSAIIPANSQAIVDLEIDVRKDKAGQVYVTGKCVNGPPFGEGAINLGIDFTGNNPVPVTECKNNMLSCGTYPDCQDLTKVNNKCFIGYLRNYWCSSNVPQYKETCSNTCCRSYLGAQASCKSISGVSTCVGPETSIVVNVTTGTIPKSVTFTLY